MYIFNQTIECTGCRKSKEIFLFCSDFNLLKQFVNCDLQYSFLLNITPYFWDLDSKPNWFKPRFPARLALN